MSELKMEVLSKVDFKKEEQFQALSAMDSRCIVIGEQTVKLEDGRVVEQWLYNIIGYEPINGKSFAA